MNPQQNSPQDNAEGTQPQVTNLMTAGQSIDAIHHESGLAQRIPAEPVSTTPSPAVTIQDNEQPANQPVSSPVTPVNPVETISPMTTPVALSAEQPVVAPQQPQVFGPQQSQASSFGPTTTPTSVQNIPGASSAPSTSQATQFGSNMQESKKRRLPGKKLLALVAVVVVLGLGGSAFAYVNIMNSSPEKVLADALANTMTDLLDQKPYKMVSNIKFESKEASNPYSVAIDIDAKKVGENGEVGATVHVEAGKVFNLSVKGRVIAEGTKTAYLKLDNLQKTVNDVVAMSPELEPMASKVRPLIQKIDGRWIKVDEKSLVSYGVADSEKKVDECTEELNKFRISKADKKRVKEIFANNQFAIASEELPSESVDGDKSYHYKLDLNGDAGLRFAKDFVELESFAAVKKACDIKQDSIDKALSDKKDNKDEEVPLKPVLELWVSKKSRYPTKLKVSANDKELTMEQVTTFKINASDISIEIPKDSMTLDELKSEIERTMSAANSTGMTQGWSAWRR